MGGEGDGQPRNAEQGHGYGDRGELSATQGPQSGQREEVPADNECYPAQGSGPRTLAGVAACWSGRRIASYPTRQLSRTVLAAAPSAAVRAQLLATEHWSLLASRSTTQTEVLSRISMLLNLVSAALVSLALVGQATRFSDTFVTFAIAVLAIVTLTGLLTQVRVMHVGNEDLMYVLTTNRLRAAYVELDPGIDRSLMASLFDDRAGLAQTYFFLQPKRGQASSLAAA